jgi:cobyrinic acid a,c-diamide synthase
LPNHPPPAILIAGTASGVGKTTVVAGLLAALRRRGLNVQPFKCGPDYIDPGYHSRAAGLPCRNLDLWMLNESQTAEAYARACAGADMAVIEGVMGLFDGSTFQNDHASAAHVAKLLGVPVILIIDISGSARSAAAVALGFKQFDPSLTVAGIILNLAGSDGHARGCAKAVEETTGLPVFGWLLRDKTLAVPERHLGLTLENEQGDADALVQRLAKAVTANFDLDALLRLAKTATTTPPATRSITQCPASGHRPRLAVARDEAFAFYYPDNLELLEAAGAEVSFFSPLAGEGLPDGSAGVYLGGGYPELHAAALSGNDPLRRDLQALHQRGGPIYAECGGFMALTEALIDGEDRRWPMYGLVPGITRMTTQIAGLGYREVVALTDNLLAPSGATIRGHEFHYSTWELPPHLAKPAWSMRGTTASSPEVKGGYTEGNLLASYLHVHFGQNPNLAMSFVDKMKRLNDLV